MDKENSRLSVSGQVLNQIQMMLKSGKFHPGDFLPSERELATSLNVGRPAVREALKALEVIGVVNIMHGRGIQVVIPSVESVIQSLLAPVTITPADLFNILEVREIIDPKCAYIAAMRATADQLQALAELLFRMNDSVNNFSEFADADYEFHFKVAEYTNNPMLKRIFEAVAALFHLQHYRTAEIPGHKETIEFHTAVYRAIYDHNPQEAEKQMAAHIQDTRRRLSNISHLEGINRR
jgi:GntR family transcriptional regulator, transcriptional repressor for pyruvate dehydrogenase complex